jgi:hypothetical protein
MTVAGALNFVWALGALVALGFFTFAELRRSRSNLRGRCRRALTVCLTAVVLFPSVSATDDLVRFEQLLLHSQARTRIASPVPEKSGQTPGLYLARLADALENLQASAVCWLLVTLGFFGFILTNSEFSRASTAPAPTGRAPPRFTSLG